MATRKKKSMLMKPAAKEERLALRIDAADVDNANVCTSHYALPISAVVRMLLRNEAQRIRAEQAARPKHLGRAG